MTTQAEKWRAQVAVAKEEIFPKKRKKRKSKEQQLEESGFQLSPRLLRLVEQTQSKRGPR